ncbi:hypothetical protein P4S72_26795 [Vibrio sp. PP-XX7]
MAAEALDQQRAQTEEELDKYLERESDKLERWARDKRDSLFETVDQLDQEIDLLKKKHRTFSIHTRKD